MSEEGLDLSYPLFSVQVSKGCAAESGGAVENEALCVSIKAAFSKDRSHAFRLD